MVQIKLLGIDDNIIRYSYKPEGEGTDGILAYNKKTDEEIIEAMAERDFKEWSARSHVFDMIRKNIDNLPKERTLMWY